MPYYGHLWPTASGALNARTTGDGYDVLYSSARLIGAKRGTTYDPVEEVQRVAWRGRSCATCPVQWFQLYFDDARSLGAKWTEFRRQGLLGTGVWTSAFEGGSGELTDGSAEGLARRRLTARPSRVRRRCVDPVVTDRRFGG